MKSGRRFRGLLLLLIAAFILISSISSFADTTTYEYDDVNRVMKVRTRGGTAIITATATEGGSISPAGAIGLRAGDSQTFDITPDPYYHIKDVIIDGSTSAGTVTSYTFNNVSGPRTIHAVFEKNVYTLNVSRNTAGGGTVTSAPEGINCGSTCSKDFESELSVSLSAAPNPGYDFIGWTSPCGTGACWVYMDANTSITALFSSQTHIITASADNKGSVSPAGFVTVNHGGSQEFIIMSNAGYSIADIKVDGTSLTPPFPSSYILSNVTADRTITASFSCNNLPVWIDGTANYYSSIQQAYDAAPNNATIKVHGIVFNESLATNVNSGSKTITIDGGYSCDYLSKSGFTTLQGSVQTTIGGGMLTLKNFFVTGSATVTTTANPPGGVYNTPQSVNLICTGSCGKTYYTTDGSTPTLSSTQYTGQIAISSNTILKFFSIDTTGKREVVHDEFYIIDTTTTPGALAINGGAVATKSAGVTLNLACHDSSGCLEMRFSSDNVTWTSPEPFADTRAWTLSAGDGIKVIYAKLKDSSGNWSKMFSDTIVLDTVAPMTSIAPLEGFYNRSIDVVLTCSDLKGSGCDTIYYTFGDTEPTTESTVYNGPITLTDVAKINFFSVDRAENKEQPFKSRTYTVDITPPTGSIKINGDAVYATNPSVTLSLACSDNTSCTQMQFSNDNETWTTPEAYATTKILTLPGGDGTKWVYVKFKDMANYWSKVEIKDSIILETGVPSTTADIAGGIFDHSLSVLLTCADSAGGAGCDKIFYSKDDSNPTLEYIGPISIDQTTTLKFFAVDYAGNKEAVKTEYYAINPILNARTNVTYTSLQTAYNEAAIEGDLIKVQGTYLRESLEIRESKPVTIEGGYDNVFVNRTGITTLKGSIQTFSGGGTIIIKNFLISQ